MAMSSQFSLSVELTKLLPFGPLARLAGKGLIELLREVQGSGSDLVTEEDLSLIFGRNRIDPNFERTFRTAVRHSVIHQVHDIAELVLEAGAGPTVRRSLKEPVYFSTVLQVSLLTWSHEITSLARSLAQTLERRARSQDTYQTPPRYDALKGTLRAIREQTSGFMWELQLAAISNKLADAETATWFDGRPIPMAVLEGLLDGLTAVQHLPENAFLRINTRTGIPTIVAWAHHVLGLSVVVQSTTRLVRFGEGRESVYINSDQMVDGKYVVASVSLLNETKDMVFHIGESLEDVPLGAATRHPVQGYGTRTIEMTLRNSEEAVGFLAHAVTTSCLSIANEGYAKSAMDFETAYRGSNVFPSNERILKVAHLLFPGNEGVLNEIENCTEYPCVARSGWDPDTLPSSVADIMHKASSPRMISFKECPEVYIHDFKELTLKLGHLMLALSLIEGIEKCGAMALELHFVPREHWVQFRLLDIREALKTIHTLLRGRDNPEFVGGVDAELAAFSSWGWTICMGSFVADDPCGLAPGLAVYQGVPMREGERRRLIIDGLRREVLGVKRKELLQRHESIAGPGDVITLGSWTKQEKTRYYIAVSDAAFEVCKVYTSRSRHDTSATSELRVGLRAMQNVFWKTVHIPACEHPAKLGQAATLHPDMWAFHGFAHPELVWGSQKKPSHDWALCREGSVHVAMVAGDSSARWTILFECAKRGGAANLGYDVLYLRSPDCCLSCALDITRNNRGGRHLGLVL